MHHRTSRFTAFAFAVLFGLASASANAQNNAGSHVVETGTMRDLGPASSSTALSRVQLVLARSPAREAALEQLLAAQQNPHSPRFHRWLTPSEFGAAFGPGDSDVAKLTAWLASRGFTAIRVNPGRTVIEFSGSVAAVDAAFHTAIHQVSRSGGAGLMATRQPSLPAELAPLAVELASLNRLPESDKVPGGPILRRDRNSGAATALADAAHPEWTVASNNTVYYAITPPDFDALYNVAPLWTAQTPIDGTGETIAIAGETGIDPADFVAFRGLFGLPLGDTGTPTGTQYLNLIYNGNNPGIRADEYHADSDTQWAAAAAKGAVIDYVASQSTGASSGVDLSAAYIVDNNLAPILVDSYFACELQLGTGGNAFYKNLWQQAAAQGITVVAAAGDSGAAACDAFHVQPASDGKAVNGIASTPWNVAVGGTEFHAPNGNAQYFSSGNSATYQSVHGYIPELVWNDSCTNPAILEEAQYAGLSAEQMCNAGTTGADGLAVTAGAGGGASSCTLSDGQTPGSCTTGYPKPWWQSASGVPADGVRDLPDVALFASQGRTNSFYAVCQRDRDPAGQGCNLEFPYADFAAYGGTELAAPAFGGILALAAQKAGERIGNPNPVFYALAARQQQAGTACDATANPAAACIFHDITLGTNAMPCFTGSRDCVTATPGDAYGILNAPAAAEGYDLASGLGSVDAYNLVNAFATVSSATASAILVVSPSSVVHGQPVTATVTVSSAAGTPTGAVSINSEAAAGSVGFGSLSGGAFTQTFRDFPGGTYGVEARYAGDSTYAAAESNFVSLTVAPEPSTATLRTLAYNPADGSSRQLSSAPYGNIWYIRADVAGQSGQGTPTGILHIDDSGALFGSGVMRLNSSGYAEGQNNALVPGTHVFSASYAGDPSFNPSTAGNATLVITQAATAASVSASAATVSAGGTVTLSAVVNTQSYGYDDPTGTVTFLSGTSVLGVSQLAGSLDPATSFDRGTATFTLSAQSLPVGSAPIAVSYSGDANYLPSSSPAISVVVAPSTLPASSTFVFPTPSTAAAGADMLYTAIVTPSSPSPTGTVQFAVDGRNAGAPQTVVPGGFSALHTNAAGLAVGLHTLTAVYSGDGKYQSSSSAVSSFLVASPGVASAVTFTASPTAAVQGTTVSVPVIVATTTSGAPMPTGSVEFVLDGSLYGGSFAIANGAITLSLPTLNLQVGTHILDVFYSGDGTYSSAYGTPVTLTLAAHGSTVSAVAIGNLPALADFGVATPFAASVTPTSPAPTGVFQLILDGGAPGAPILLSGAASQLALPASLALGPHTLRVFYSGDDTYNFASSPALSFTVVLPDFTLTPPQSATVSNLLQPPPLTITVTPTYGFNTPIAFSCTGLPSNTACVFSPATVVPDGTDSASTTLNFALDTGVAAALRRANLGGGQLAEAAGMLCLALPLALGRPRPRKPRSIWLALAICALGALNGCGTGFPKAAGLSPPGTYAITVVASSATETHTTVVELTIQ